MSDVNLKLQCLEIFRDLRTAQEAYEWLVAPSPPDVGLPAQEDSHSQGSGAGLDTTVPEASERADVVATATSTNFSGETYYSTTEGVFNSRGERVESSGHPQQAWTQDASDPPKVRAGEPAVVPVPGAGQESRDLPEGFTKWEGGGCPVDPGAFVEVVLRCGEMRDHRTHPNASYFNWSHSEPGWYSYRSDIVAYRVVGLPADLPADEGKAEGETAAMDRARAELVEVVGTEKAQEIEAVVHALKARWDEEDAKPGSVFREQADAAISQKLEEVE